MIAVLSVYVNFTAWLPVKQRIVYKICTLVYKCQHGIAPDCLCNKLIRKGQVARSLRPNSDIHQLKVPKIFKETNAARSFSYVGRVWWNQLEIKTRASIGFHDFKYNLKTELLKVAFKL